MKNVSYSILVETSYLASGIRIHPLESYSITLPYIDAWPMAHRADFRKRRVKLSGLDNHA